MSTSPNILAITASSRAAANSTALVKDAIAAITASHPGGTVVHHDVARHPVPVVTEAWVAGAYTDPAERTSEQNDALALSDKLVAEVMAADIIIVGTPIYNFSVPAALKAWIDQIVRARLTFRFKDGGGYEGLVPSNKKVYVIATSGGVPVGSPYDLATSYLKQIFGFIGLTDVTVVAADQVMTVGESQIDKARGEIATMFAKVAA